MSDKSSDLYTENIMDHFRRPRNKQKIKNPIVEHEETNLSCGDEISVQLEIEDGVIKKIGWGGTGCAISQAGTSILSEEIEGKKTDEVMSLGKEDVYKLLGVPVGPRRIKCALLCLHTIKNALRKSEGHSLQGWLDTVEIDED